MKYTILVWCHKNGTIDRHKKVVGLAESAGVSEEYQHNRRDGVGFIIPVFETYAAGIYVMDRLTRCRRMTSITLPGSVKDISRVKTIGEWAFFGCIGLTSVTIYISVTNIGDYAFTVAQSIGLTLS